MNSDMNRFISNPVFLDMDRSIFPRNHSVKFSGDVGECIPFLLEEVLPSDTWSINTSKVIRLQPLVSPILDDLFLDCYYFYTPSRILWTHWKEFMGENNTSAWTPEIEYTVPQIKVPSGGFAVGTIADYLGIPPKVGANKTISALPFRAYAMICDQWFRDQNNMNPVHITLDDSTVTGSNGSDQTTDIEKGGQPFIACKVHDYFTSCLPNAQKVSATQVQFALNGLLPVNAYSNKSSITAGDTITAFDSLHMMKKVSGVATAYTGYESPIITGTGNMNSVSTSSQTGQSTSTPINLFADLNNTSVFDINELRTAFAIQKYYERLALGGSRYREIIRSFFGTTSPDGRMQVPEYLGGNRVHLNISQIEQTSATQESLTPQGNLVGQSLTGDTNSDFTKSFTEHGYIIGIAVLRYKHTYSQGCERHWLRKTKTQYYFPVFANLGLMPVYERELWFQADDDEVFGYQSYAEDYRFKPNRVCGEMRSVHDTPLDSWHLADNYTSKPTLTDSWIREDKTMLDRCLAVTSSVSNQYFADFFIEAHVSRVMPAYSVPGLIDHH